jgi:hypothetical protein
VSLRAWQVLALIDANDLTAAWEILARHPQDRRCALQYSRALIRYVGWAVLGEEGATEEAARAELEGSIAVRRVFSFFFPFFFLNACKDRPLVEWEYLPVLRPPGVPGAALTTCHAMYSFAGESKRLVVESPWSQFTSECQRF